MDSKDGEKVSLLNVKLWASATCERLSSNNLIVPKGNELEKTITQWLNSFGLVVKFLSSWHHLNDTHSLRSGNESQTSSSRVNRWRSQDFWQLEPLKALATCLGDSWWIETTFQICKLRSLRNFISCVHQSDAEERLILICVRTDTRCVCFAIFSLSVHGNVDSTATNATSEHGERKNSFPHFAHLIEISVLARN